MGESFEDRQDALHRVSRFYQRVINRAMGRKGYATARRYRKKKSFVVRKLRHNRAAHAQAVADRTAGNGLVWFDGHKIAAWIAVELHKARKAGWKGYLVSGWRDPAYSESLCFRMCGRPSCPGRCAGRKSNHSGIFYPEGAGDVTEFWSLQRLCRTLGLRIHNSLPVTDPVHFSASGA